MCAAAVAALVSDSPTTHGLAGRVFHVLVLLCDSAQSKHVAC